MEATKMRVGVWGLGRHARKRILPALSGCADTELLGVTTRDTSVAAAEAATHGCRVWESPEAMLADPDLDAVYVATPIGVHAAQGHRVLEAGKHLWMEKSLTESFDASTRLLEAAGSRDLAVCEAFMYAYHPQFERVLSEVSSEHFGAIVSIESSFGMPVLDAPGFRHDAALGGGALLDVGCYPLSAALRIDGPAGGPPPEVVSAELRRPAGFEVDMEGHVLLRFPSGAMAFLQWGFGRAYRNDLQVWGRSALLRADRAFSKLDDYPSEVVVGDLRGSDRVLPVGAANPFDRMLSAFTRDSRSASGRERLRAEALALAELLQRVRKRAHRH